MTTRGAEGQGGGDDENEGVHPETTKKSVSQVAAFARLWGDDTSRVTVFLTVLGKTPRRVSRGRGARDLPRTGRHSAKALLSTVNRDAYDLPTMSRPPQAVPALHLEKRALKKKQQNTMRMEEGQGSGKMSGERKTKDEQHPTKLGTRKGRTNQKWTTFQTIGPPRKKEKGRGWPRTQKEQA